MATDKEKEKVHDQLYENLNSVSQIALDTLDPVHVLASGLDYFLTSAYTSAPSIEEADVLINASIKRAKEENNG
mgnify:CR=1 FL=1|tara:strand:- start:14178 stop:14399 length:222 start_codon:yes stop_codon:yes gene_type:complete